MGAMQLGEWLEAEVFEGTKRPQDLSFLAAFQTEVCPGVCALKEFAADLPSTKAQRWGDV